MTSLTHSFSFKVMAVMIVFIFITTTVAPPVAYGQEALFQDPLAPEPELPTVDPTTVMRAAG